MVALVAAAVAWRAVQGQIRPPRNGRESSAILARPHRHDIVATLRRINRRERLAVTQGSPLVRVPAVAFKRPRASSPVENSIRYMRQ
jgi:hypothetical protein